MVRTTVRIAGRVERLWPNATVVCLASGPSLTREDVDYCNGKAKVIAINTTITLAPWADAFHACDLRVWQWHRQHLLTYQGLRFSLDAAASEFGATVLRNGGVWGLSADPTALSTGRNSGYQAINLSVLLGASRVILVGYDMQRGPDGEKHWHGEHPNRTEPPYASCIAAFKTLVEPLKAAGVDVVNCSRLTALEMFPRLSLEEALS